MSSAEIAEQSYRPPTEPENIPQDKPLALFDLDGTLTQPGTKLVLEKFVNNEQYDFGIPERRLEIKELFEQWGRENKLKINIKQYENLLRNAGFAFAQMCRGRKRQNVVEQGQRWYSEEGNRLVMPYSHDVIGQVKEAGFRPVIVTGAPFELAYSFANDLGVEDVFAMEAEVDESDTYTGEMDITKNIGLNLNKVSIRRRLSKKGHLILFAMGDTGSDVPLFRGAIEFHHQNDGRGQAVLINPSPDVDEGSEFWLREWIADGKLHKIPQGRESHFVARTIRHVISDVLEDNKEILGRK